MINFANLSIFCKRRLQYSDGSGHRKLVNESIKLKNSTPRKSITQRWYYFILQEKILDTLHANNDVVISLHAFLIRNYELQPVLKVSLKVSSDYKSLSTQRCLRVSQSSISDFMFTATCPGEHSKTKSFILPN